MIVGLALLGVVAWATPPDALDSYITPLCADGDRLMALLHLRSNLGTHYHGAHAWSATLVDFDAATIAFRHQGGLISNHVNVESPGDAPEASWPEVEPAPIAPLFGEWALTECMAPTGNVRAMSAEPFVYGWAEGGLTVGLSGRVRTAAGARLYDLRSVAPEPPDYAGPPGPMPIEPVEGFALELLTDGSLQETARIRLATREILILQASVDGETAAALVDLPDVALSEARSWLINATGYDLHREGDWAGSKARFLRALQVDPDNALARYNLACAYARLEDAPAAVRALQGLPPDAALREKIERDPDFDPVRKSAHLKDFLTSIEEAP